MNSDKKYLRLSQRFGLWVGFGPVYVISNLSIGLYNLLLHQLFFKVKSNAKADLFIKLFHFTLKFEILFLRF